MICDFFGTLGRKSVALHKEPASGFWRKTVPTTRPAMPLPRAADPVNAVELPAVSVAIALAQDWKAYDPTNGSCSGPARPSKGTWGIPTRTAKP